MATKFSFGKIEFDVSLGAGKGAPRHEPGMPFVLAILGDFSGRSNRGLIEPAHPRRLWRVDCDNFEKVQAGLGARLGLSLPEKPAEAVGIQIETLEDFHPDRLLRAVGSLGRLVSARKRLLNPATSSDAARELQVLLASQPTAAATTAPPAAGAESNEDTLARLLGGTAPPAAAAQVQPGSVVDRLIRNLVAPSIVPGTSAQQTALLSAVDLELTRQLRLILPHPDFQSLEAAWRGLDMLVRNFGAEENLKICLADIS